MSSDSDEEYNPGAVPVALPSQPHTSASPSTPTAVSEFANELNAGTGNAIECNPPGATKSTAAAERPPSRKSGTEAGWRLHGLKGRVRTVCVNLAGTVLCAGGEDGQLCMWDFESPLSSRRIQPTRALTPFVNRISGLQPIVCVHAAMDGAYFVACQDGDSPVIVSSRGKQMGYCAMGERGLVDVVRCRGHRSPVTASARHMTNAGCFFTSSQDGTARLWDCAGLERGSTYAVKHGSGQLMDTVVVESVLGLSGALAGGHGALFASGGEDGLVQLWDSRAKYRPGCSVATWDTYALNWPDASPTGVAEEVFEKHVGGLVELNVGGAAALGVRIGGTVKIIDLRASALQPRSPGQLRSPPITGLPFITDTTPLCSGGGAMGESGCFITCTSRAGYRHVAGGHVVRFAHDSAAGHFTVRDSWCAGSADEDVLCACVDEGTTDGSLFAGLNTGDVVVRLPLGSIGGSPVEKWLATRPEKEGKGDERVVGQKAPRELMAPDTDDWADLF